MEEDRDEETLERERELRRNHERVKKPRHTLGANMDGGTRGRVMRKIHLSRRATSISLRVCDDGMIFFNKETI